MAVKGLSGDKGCEATVSPHRVDVSLVVTLLPVRQG